MKKSTLILLGAISIFCMNSNYNSYAAEPQTVSSAAKQTVKDAQTTAKLATDATVKTTKDVAKTVTTETKSSATKVSDATKSAANKTVEASKDVAKAVATETKSSAAKVSEAAKSATNTTVFDTKATTNTIKNETKATAAKTNEEIKSLPYKAETKTQEVKELSKEEVNTIKEESVEASKEAILPNTIPTADNTAPSTRISKNKTIDADKNFATKTAEATKSAAKKTKDMTVKAVDNTKDFIEDLPPREITVENLEKEANIKTLKNEKKEISDAYTSRIKDTKAKLKATEKSTVISDTERRSRIHILNKQVENLNKEKNAAVLKYNDKIEAAKQKDIKKESNL